jgi:hypothetical protein
MPKRSRSHEIEDISRRRLRDTFAQLGWVVWDLYPDYGEDLLVRIFTNTTATHYSFFVQAKGTDHLDRYLHRDGKHISFPIDIEHWKKFWEPVVLTIWDSKSGATYWEIIQDCQQSNNLDLAIIRKPTGLTDWYYFDESAEVATELSSKTWMEPSQFVLSAMLQGLIDDRDDPETKVLVRNNGNICIFSKDGDMIGFYQALEEFSGQELQKFLRKKRES